jgi:large subunit ribosomal protein L5
VKPRLQEKYESEVVKTLLASGQYKNLHQVPRLEKVIVHMGVNTAAQKASKGALEEANKELGMITGQKPAPTKSRHNISNFNLRLGQEIGCRVTLRGKRMYEFLDRLISAALPRIRDFRGIPNRGFDGRGSYSLGLDDQTIFPEIELDKIKRPQGMDVTIVTSARNNQQAREMLKMIGMPFAAQR